MPKHKPFRGSKARNQHRSSGSPAPSAPFVAEVRDLSSDGRGVVSAPDGRVVFVPGVWPGEQIRVVIRAARGRVAEGELLELQLASPARRDPPCAYHGFSEGECGGCSWQFVAYEAQVEAKRSRLQSLVDRHADQPLAVEVIDAPQEWHYRNRAQFKTNGTQLGYVSRGSRLIADVDSCPILTANAAMQLTALRAQLPNKRWQPQRRGGWSTLDIDDERDEPMLNERQPFRQGNSAQNQRMRDWLATKLESIELEGEALELFAGNGNFTEVLAQTGLSVTAAEIEVTDLERRAVQWPGVSVHPCNLFDAESAQALARRCKNAALLLLDPPRDGFLTREHMLPAMKQLRHIIYISCDPASWARDASYLRARGFALTSVTMIDLFPQTPHIEVMSTFAR